MSTKAKPHPGKGTGGEASASESSVFRRLLGFVWRPGPLVLLSLTLTGVMFWPQIVSRLPDLAERDEYLVTWEDVRIPTMQQWIPEDLLVRVRTHSGLPETLSILDDDLAQRLTIAFAAQPWVASVDCVRKEPGRIHVELTYREPVAMVQTRRGMYPVDVHGVLLPPADFSAKDAQQFPRIDQVRTAPQGPAGREWGDTAVAGAAKLAAELTHGDDQRSPWERFGLRSIVVLAQPGPVADVEDVIYGLTTDNSSRIVWGHAPGADALEPTVAQKMERLDKFLADNGGFEYLNEPVLIDIRDWELIRWDVLSRLPSGTNAIR